MKLAILLLLLAVSGVKAKHPTVHTSNRNVAACIGTNGFMVCHVVHPYEDPKWSAKTKAGEYEITNSTDHFEITPDEYIGDYMQARHLRVLNVTKADEGVYTCRAVAYGHTKSDTSTLTVVECPEEVLITVKFGEKTMSFRHKATEYNIRAMIKMPVKEKVNIGGNGTITCSVVAPGSETPLNTTSVSHEVNRDFDACRVHYNGVEYESFVDYVAE